MSKQGVMTSDETEEQYLVSWEIDIWESSPEVAALRALEIMRDPSSIATIFNVKHVRTGEVKVLDTEKL